MQKTALELGPEGGYPALDSSKNWPGGQELIQAAYKGDGYRNQRELGSKIRREKKAKLGLS
jgi:hypothetical protein